MLRVDRCGQLVELSRIDHPGLQTHLVAPGLDRALGHRDRILKLGDLRDVGSVLSLKCARSDQVVPRFGRPLNSGGSSKTAIATSAGRLSPRLKAIPARTRQGARPGG
jgi:hypothetical protein